MVRASMVRGLLFIASVMAGAVAAIAFAVWVDARLPVTPVPSVASAITPTPPPPTATGCTLVELQPGYPGYRGFVTGLAGRGEAACLEDLTRLDPRFDRAREDTENV